MIDVGFMTKKIDRFVESVVFIYSKRLYKAESGDFDRAWTGFTVKHGMTSLQRT